MMDVDEGQYDELDPVRAQIWGLLETARSTADLCDALAAEFAVAPDTCHRDTLEFLQAASAMRIVHVQPDETAFVWSSPRGAPALPQAAKPAPTPRRPVDAAAS